jgi:hypothetical protein
MVVAGVVIVHQVLSLTIYQPLSECIFAFLQSLGPFSVLSIVVNFCILALDLNTKVKIDYLRAKVTIYDKIIGLNVSIYYE